MYLKTLQLRGFKSFASATTLELEPGVTAVVGPNGSGKSNVVDALAWVMGEQGAKTLRGGKMEDVIFAGTKQRPPLGRAEVRLTIDNSDGALPIDYAEVTISRTLFRNGGSEYAINGSSCRLLDVQDLLSDSGLGREMHVIVGQGQLDAVLSATPEERRGFIEEAAGVLKHRKRKERALRRLDAMQENMHRVEDLTHEIRRQLGPLGRQADVARRAHTIQAEARDAKARLLADDLVRLRTVFEADEADERALREEQAAAEEALASTRNRLAVLEAEAARAAPEISLASETWFRLSAVRERLRGTVRLAQERSRLLGESEQEYHSELLVNLDDEAARLRKREHELSAEIESYRDTLAATLTAREAAEAAEHAEDRRVADELRAVADRREGLARLTGEVAAARSAVEGHEARIAQLREDIAAAQGEADESAREFTALEIRIAGAERGEEGLDAEHESAVKAQSVAEADVEHLEAERRNAETEKATWVARHGALELSLQRKDGSAALMQAGRPAGILGSLASLITVEPGYENAVAALLGRWADAVVVESAGAAVDAMRRLRGEEAGQAEFLIAAGDNETTNPEHSFHAPSGSWTAIDLVTCEDQLRPALADVLADAVVVDDLATARRAVDTSPHIVVATKRGDVLSARWARGGSDSAPSTIELQAAYDESSAQISRSEADIDRAVFALSAARSALESSNAVVQSTLERLNESDAKLAAVAERLGQLSATTRGARDRADRSSEQLERAEADRDAAAATLEELAARLTRAEHDDSGVAKPPTDARESLAAASAGSRAAETEARLALRTAEEQVAAVATRAGAAEKAVEAENMAREQWRKRAERRQRQGAVAMAVLHGAEQLVGVVDGSLAEAATWRDTVERDREARDAELGELRLAVESHRSRLEELTDAAHRDEIARTAQKMQLDQLEQRAIDELGLDVDTLVGNFGPNMPVPVVPASGTLTDAAQENMPESGAVNEPETVPYVRDEQEKRLKKAEGDLARLGKVNPLALEEYEALQQRHNFLGEQLADLQKSRNDLMEVVREVDERVEQVFAQAYRDTADAFEKVFARLFPGGEGHLVATEPGDMLATGVDVEARPAGKSVKRLSLLSGGERSLVAVAFVVAIFMARPSPFYVMDEVEAALDDANLGRLLEIFEELRNSSQLIIVTHQKRTMEIADALYGVSMRGDGVTTVISQRLRED